MQRNGAYSLSAHIDKNLSWDVSRMLGVLEAPMQWNQLQLILKKVLWVSWSQKELTTCKWVSSHNLPVEQLPKAVSRMRICVSTVDNMLIITVLQRRMVSATRSPRVIQWWLDGTISCTRPKLSSFR